MQLEFNHPDFQSPKHAIVSLSGGMDSSTLLLKCLEKFETVTALSFDYGQKHKVELKRARALVDYLNRQCNDNNCYGGCKINYQVIKLDGLVDLLDSALVEGGDEVPEGHYAAENMKATVVPNRNKIFASITQAVALSVANRTGENTVIALGIHAGDHDIYPDCRQEFRDADDKAFREGNWDAEKVGYYTPYLKGDKFTILQDGEILCETLGIDFDEVYARTNTSYKPTPEGWSDYKSASSVERVEAFIKLGRPDPVQYADETGPVDYETARIYVEQVLSEHAKEQFNKVRTSNKLNIK
jgi:7-cyano-7-deazaguanine synthase|tara:strand:- start:690 stop:1586 length:897 start_codon:yes stop_codon:yes gene_type:complete